MRILIICAAIAWTTSLGTPASGAGFRGLGEAGARGSYYFGANTVYQEQGPTSVPYTPLPYAFDESRVEPRSDLTYSGHIDASVFSSVDMLAITSFNAELSASGTSNIPSKQITLTGNVTISDSTAGPTIGDNVYYFAAMNYFVHGTVAEGDSVRFYFNTTSYVASNSRILAYAGTNGPTWVIDTPGSFSFLFSFPLTMVGTYFPNGDFPHGIYNSGITMDANFAFIITKGNGGGTTTISLNSGGSTDMYGFGQPFAPVPEPASLAMAGLGGLALAGLAAGVRRRANDPPSGRSDA